MLHLLARLLALPELLDHGLHPPLLLPLGLGAKLEVGRLDLVAVGVHALPQIEYFRLAVEIEVQLVFDKLLDLCKPFPRGLFVRRDDDGVVSVSPIELCPEETDAELIELIEGDVCEVLGADVPQRDALLSFRAGVDHFAKKTIKAEEVFITLRVLLSQLLEPLRR